MLQQFGLCPFQLKLEDESMELTIPLEEPFPDAQYTLVATTDHPACYASIKEKKTDSVTIQIIRTRFSPELGGVINWNAVGYIN